MIPTAASARPSTRRSQAAAKNFEEVVAHLFPGGRGRLRLVSPERPRAVVIGGETRGRGRGGRGGGRGGRRRRGAGTPTSRAWRWRSPRRASPRSACPSCRAGRSRSWRSPSCSRSSSPGRVPSTSSTRWRRRSTTCNIDRFLQLVRRYSDRAQFIVVTHQKRTMDAADRLYGVSMGGDGVVAW